MEETTVHRLVRERDAATLRDYLRSISDPGAAANELDEDGNSPLFTALFLGGPDLEVVEVLLSAGADPCFVKVTSLTGDGLALEDDLEGLKEAGIDIELLRNLPRPSEMRESIVEKALGLENPAFVRLLAEHGADLSYRDEHGYTAMLHAIHGPGDRLPVVRYLLSLGLDTDSPSIHNETPVGSAYRFGDFEVLRELLAAGADDAGLQWTPLLRAVALGTREDVDHELQRNQDLEARDVYGRTALQVALLRGDADLCGLLRSKGAKLNRRRARRDTESDLSLAIQGGNPATIEWLVGQGVSLTAHSFMGQTPLAEAAETGNLEVVQYLLSAGADPNAKLRYGSVLECASSGDVVAALLAAGADPADLRHEGKRALLGLGGEGANRLLKVTRAEYLAGRSPKEGRANPEDVTGPFRIAMIRDGCNAYQPRRRFDDLNFSCPVAGSRGDPVWCADRFGQSLTRLPDGRTILIAGEHEDSYDPDFCIYNDVIVFHPDGDIRIYCYPYSVFPPTDFHTATLVGDEIYIIGSLGYLDERRNDSCVYRLSTVDYHIEHVETRGDSPGRIYGHRANLIGTDRIQVEGGTMVRFKGLKEQSTRNGDVYTLELHTMVWSRS